MRVVWNAGLERTEKRRDGAVHQLDPLWKWPKSFQDAVLITRRFNVRFLWIDNTSIKQDDQADWVVESQKMATYFSNASLTLVPMWAQDDDCGIFHDRNPLLDFPLCLIPSSSYYTSFKGLDRVNEHEVVGAPLFSRAWVLQEQQLSRRLLKFGSKGIHWECFSCYATTARIVPEEHDVYQHRAFANGQPLTMHIYPDSSRTSTVAGRNPYLDLWYATVQEFTSRNMKMKRDALPAISGLAQAYASYIAPDDRYVAGLWQSDLRLGLLWTAGADSSRDQPAPFGVNYDLEGFTAPSWSWISQCHKRIYVRFDPWILPGGKCHYSEQASLIATEVTNVSITFKPSSEPYGEIIGGRISFKAKLAAVGISTASYAMDSTAKSRRAMLNDSLARTDVHCLAMEEAPFSHRVSSLRVEGERGRAFLGECHVDDSTSAIWLSHARDGFVDATFLPLTMYQLDPEGLRMAGLVIVPTENDDEFVRIGRAEIDLPNSRSLRESTLSFRTISII